MNEIHWVTKFVKNQRCSVLKKTEEWFSLKELRGIDWEVLSEKFPVRTLSQPIEHRLEHRSLNEQIMNVEIRKQEQERRQKWIENAWNAPDC